MDKDHLIDSLTAHVREYARGRASDVARGAETPHLAALLLQKYGVGIIAAVQCIFDDRRAADPLTRVVDEETARIDPDWRAHARARQAARPADIGLRGSDAGA